MDVYEEQIVAIRAATAAARDAYEEQTVAIRAAMAAARAELARTEESLAITRVALALRQAVLLDTELQLAQVKNYQRALDIAKRANLGPLGPPRTQNFDPLESLRTEVSLRVALDISSTYWFEPTPRAGPAHAPGTGEVAPPQLPEVIERGV